MTKTQQDGRKSLFAASGALISCAVMLVLGGYNLFGPAFSAIFGLINGFVLLLFPLLSLFGCVAGFVYGASSWRTRSGKCGVMISLGNLVLLALLYRGVVPTI